MTPSASRQTLLPLLPALMAGGGGLILSLCFAAQPRPWLACFAFVPLVLLLQRQRSWFWGWCFGTAFWLGSMSWIEATLVGYGGLPEGLSKVLMVALAIYLGADFALFGWLGQRLWRSGGATAIWALPALWVVVEWKRAFMLGGFAWNLAAHSWAEMPGALASSAWIGARGVSFLVLVVNVGLALAISTRRWQLPAMAVTCVTVFLALFAWQPPADVPAGSLKRHGQEDRGLEVRVVQPNSAIVIDTEQAQADYRRLLAMSRAECDGTPGLLIWPESAAWPYSYHTTARLRRDVAELTAAGCQVLLGSPVRRPSGTFNTAVLVSEFGLQGEYAKRKLVPWGEYVPLAKLIPWVGKLARNAGDFTAGDTVGLLPLQQEQLAVAICYEVIFAGAVAEQVRAGATVLTTITNDAWYGDTAAPWQHLVAVRFRAAENHRPMLRSALTGISAVIGPRGEVLSSLEVGESGVLRASVRGETRLTPFSRAPGAVIAICALLAGFAIVRARWRLQPPTAGLTPAPQETTSR